MKLFHSIILSLILFTSTAAVGATPARGPLWDTVEHTEADSMPVQQEGALEVKVLEGNIYITTTETVKVEVFTILGQLVTSRIVNPGTVRLSLGQRGIYIVKGAGLARRVSL